MLEGKSVGLFGAFKSSVEKMRMILRHTEKDFTLKSRIFAPGMGLMERARGYVIILISRGSPITGMVSQNHQHYICV